MYEKAGCSRKRSAMQTLRLAAYGFNHILYAKPLPAMRKAVCLVYNKRGWRLVVTTDASDIGFQVSASARQRLPSARHSGATRHLQRRLG